MKIKVTTKNYTKVFVQLNSKPALKKKYEKHNSPKKRSTGIGLRGCKNCGRYGAHIRSYGLHLCRMCFRDMAKSLGFKKFN